MAAVMQINLVGRGRMQIMGAQETIHKCRWKSGSEEGANKLWHMMKEGPINDKGQEVAECERRKCKQGKADNKERGDGGERHGVSTKSSVR